MLTFFGGIGGECRGLDLLVCALQIGTGAEADAVLELLTKRCLQALRIAQGIASAGDVVRPGLFPHLPEGDVKKLLFVLFSGQAQFEHAHARGVGTGREQVALIDEGFRILAGFEAQRPAGNLLLPVKHPAEVLVCLCGVYIVFCARGRYLPKG